MRKKKPKKLQDKVYMIGVILTLLGLAGMAEAVTGQGLFFVAEVIFSVGFACILFGYSDMWHHKDNDPYKDL